MEETLQLFDICIICALYEEARALIDEISTRCGVTFAKAFRPLNQLEYRHATIQNQRGEPLHLFVTWLSEMGPVRTALDFKPLLHEIRPRFVAMTGVCAGDRRKVKLGDLIVATDAYHPEKGKITTEADGQPVHLPEITTAGMTTQVLQYVRGFEEWKVPVRELKREQLKRAWKATDDPQCHIEVMASSMAVRADNPFPQWTGQYNRNSVGADMEAATFYTALRDFPLVQGLVVKGVSDYGDRTKTDRYRNYARRASAVYLLHFIQEYVTHETMPRRDAPPSEGRAGPSGVWNVPYLRNPHFTGRDEIFEQLDQHLSSTVQDAITTTRRAALTQPQAIKGLGGIGKTQIAIEYAYRSVEQGHYLHTFWVNAASEEALLTSFATIAELLPAFSAKNETDQQKLVAAIKHWLEQCKQRWLLIFDNADDVSVLREYLPQRGNGSILLTTRADAVGSLAASVEVEIMDFIEGTHLLLRRAQRFDQASDEEINQVGNIVVALDHFPLALDQAGAYIEETQCSFGEYLTIYQNHRKSLLARRGMQATHYPDSVATTWSLSFQKVEQANPAAADLLRLCAYLSPDRIPEELIKDGAAHWTSSLQRAVVDLFTFNQMIAELLKFSLVKRLVEDQMLSIHRLVQAVQLDMMEPEVQRQWARRVILAVNEVFPRGTEDEATWPQCLRYLEQAQACDTLIRQHLLVLPEAADLLYQTANYLRVHTSYTLAEPLYQRALDIREQQVATSLHGLATLYAQQGKYAEAEPLFQRTLRIREQQLGPEHPQVAASLHNLAILYYQQGKYAEAEPLYQRALRIWEQQLGPEHPDVAYPLNGLANLYYEQGKYAEAEPLFQRTLRIWEQQLGSEHLFVAHSLTNLANLYREQDKYVEAEPLYQRALRILEQQEQPDVAHPLDGLANLYREQDKYVEAELLYQRALHILEQQLGPEHPETAEVMYDVALLQEAQGNRDGAKPLYEHALAVRKRVLGPQHPKTKETRNRYLTLLREMGQSDEAASLEAMQSEPTKTEEEQERRPEE